MYETIGRNVSIKQTGFAQYPLKLSEILKLSDYFTTYWKKQIGVFAILVNVY